VSSSPTCIAMKEVLEKLIWRPVAIAKLLSISFNFFG
jgi:hypothetical protein